VPKVLPAVTLLGVGVAMTVAPWTGTIVAAAPRGLAGTVCGVSNGVARTARLLAVAALPLNVGLNGSQYTDPNQPRADLSDDTADLCRGNRRRR
jgi:hypothetical protein